MPTTRDEALTSVGRYGKVNQVLGPGGDRGPFWYGQVAEVHSSGDYLKFSIGTRLRHRWYHRRNVHLHALDSNTTGQPAALQAGTTGDPLKTGPSPYADGVTADDLLALSKTQTEVIHEHRIGGASLRVRSVIDAPYHAAGQFYVAETDLHDTNEHPLEFHRGNPAEVGFNGWTNEALLAVLIHRVGVLDAAVPCAENKAAIEHMQSAVGYLNRRTTKRQARGVEGTQEA